MNTRQNFLSVFPVLNKGKHISYAGCGLPYYVGHVIEEKEQLIVNTPEKYEKLTGVTVLTETEAVRVDPKDALRF